MEMPPTPLSSLLCKVDEGFNDALEGQSCRQTQDAEARHCQWPRLGCQDNSTAQKNISFIAGSELWATHVIPYRIQGLG